MISISIRFARAASAKTGIGTGFSTFWMMVFAIAILDDAERREKEQRKKRESARQPRRPKPPTGPRPF